MLKSAVTMLLCSALLSVSVAQTPSKPVTVFSVGGKPVNSDEFLYLYKKNHPNKATDYTPEKIDEYLALFINFKVKVDEAKRRGMDTTAAFLKEYNSYKDELRKPYLPDAKLIDSLVRLTYDRMKEEIRASHILISLSPDPSPEDTLKAYKKITDIRNKILSGIDFAEAAATYSEDPSAQLNRGDLGYFTALQMVYPFETAAYQLKVGEMSQPVRTRFGYHLVKVTDRRPSPGEVEVSHIMLRTGDGKDNEKVKNTIFGLYDQLQAGVKWEELCKQYSEDPSSKDNGGRLRPFGPRGMSGVPEFEKVAFNLRKPGELSDPFQTQYGWHIVRLEKKIPLPSLEEATPALKAKVARDERSEVSKQALQAKLKQRYQFKENVAAKAAVMGLADSSLMKGTWKAPALKTEKEMLFSLMGKPHSVKDFLVYAQKNQRPNIQAPRKYFEELYNHYVEASIMPLVEDKIKAQNPDYSFLLREYYEGILLFEIMEKEVWNKASQDSVGQKAYFEAHKADYTAGDRVKAAFYSGSAGDFMTPLRELILKGDEAKVQEMVILRKLKTETGYYKKDDKAVLQKMPWTKGVYPAENNGIYYLAWLKEILPPGFMAFEEARPQVISDYQTFLEKKWLEQLKKKHTVKVNEKGKKFISEQLQAK
jgi:peptidyl-prolyl cis-trans isomerase SurA